MHSLLVKIVSLTSLFVLTFVSGIIPIKLRGRPGENDPNKESRDLRRRQIISLSTCFAGGAFFASSMLELLPMVRREFESVLENANIDTMYPLPEFGVSVGFFLILIVEQIIHVMKEKRTIVTTVDSETPTCSSALVGNGDGKHYGATILQKHLQDEDKYSDSVGSDDDSHDSSHDASHDATRDQDLHKHHVHDHDGHLHRTYIFESDHQHGHGIEDSGRHSHDHSMFFNRSHKHQNQRHYLRSYFLLIALSIHALFEGLAVGLFQNVDSMVELLGALIIHKCILAFSIGINLVQHSFPSFMIIKSAFLFSAMSPIGLGFGILMLTYTAPNLGHVLSAIFQAIATGTFLYVTFFEIFFHELNGRECHKLLKVLMMIFGFALLAVVQFFDTRVNK